MAVLTTSVDPAMRPLARTGRVGGAARRARGAARPRLIGGGERPARHRFAASSPRASASSPARRGVALPEFAAGRLGERVPRRRRDGHRDRRGVGRRASSSRRDPTVRGGSMNPYTLKKNLRALEIAEPPPAREPRRVGRCRPPHAGRSLRARGQIFRDLTELSAMGIPRSLRLRELDRRRCVRARHVRLLGARRPARQGVPWSRHW